MWINKTSVTGRRWTLDSCTKFGVIGPYFFEENGRSVTVNSARYVAMIQDFLVPALRKRRLNRFRIWFQQDGATAHTSREAMAEYGGYFLGSSSPIEVMCRGPPALRTCHLAIFFCGGTSKEKCTSTSHEIFLSWRMQLRRNCAPYLAECVSRCSPTSEAQRVRQKPGSSFKRRYFSRLTMFWNIRMVFLNCNISCVY